jgi:hypothetical protein
MYDSINSIRPHGFSLLSVPPAVAQNFTPDRLRNIKCDLGMGGGTGPQNCCCLLIGDEYQQVLLPPEL